MSLSNFFLKISINFSGDNFNRESLLKLVLIFRRELFEFMR